MYTACKVTKIQWCSVAPEWSERKVSLAVCKLKRSQTDQRMKVSICRWQRKGEPAALSMLQLGGRVPYKNGKMVSEGL